MIKTPKTITSQLFSLVLITGLAYFLFNNWERFRSVADLSACNVIVLIGLVFFSRVLGSCQTILIMRHVGIRVTLLESFALVVGAQLGNYLPVPVGTFVRMSFFKKVHNLRYSIFSGFFSAKTIIIIASTSFTGLFGTTVLFFFNDNQLTPIFLIYLGSTVVSIIACLMPLPKVNGSQKLIWQLWKDFRKGYETIRMNLLLMFQLFSLITIQCLLLAVRFWVLFEAIGQEAGPVACLVLAPATLFFTLVSLTPGNLGLREWLIGILSIALDLNIEGGLFVGIIDRAIMMVCIFPVGGLSLVYIRSRIRRASFEQSGKQKP